jgi:hypothetical protein
MHNPARSLLLLALAISPLARGNELFLSHQQLVEQGFHVQRQDLRDRVDAPHAWDERPLTLPFSAPAIQAGSLDWPVAFPDRTHTLGNNMIQFQQYGPSQAYYHGGCDLRVKQNAWVTAPVSGRLEAGHYGYEMNPDGSATKWWKAWPEAGEALYFEVAVVTDDGTRFEFHHIDENQLSPEALKILKAGGGEIAAGAKLGRVVTWSVEGVDGEIYHHTHYNIIKENVEWNPEHFSKILVKDGLAPTLSGVFAVAADGQVAEVAQGSTLLEAPVEFVVAATDQRENDVYTQAPSFAEIMSDANPALHTTWDFRQYLRNPDGSFPPIFDFYLKSLDVGSRTLRTEGNYKKNFFLIRLKMPADTHGPFTIRVGDAVGNMTTFKAVLP